MSIHSTQRANNFHEIEHIKDFENLRNNPDNGLICVYFWAPWCGPCRDFGPLFLDVSAANPHVHFCKINVDTLRDLAASYAIQSIPTIFLLKAGENDIKKKHIGRMSEEEFQSFITLDDE